MMEEKSLERIDLETEAGMLIKRLTEEQAQTILEKVTSSRLWYLYPRV